MSYILSPTPKLQFIDDNGAPLAGGYLYSYAAGTNTPRATYADSRGAANTNPVILDAGGRAVVWIDDRLSYKYVIKTASGTLWATADNINSSSGIQEMTVLTVAAMRNLTVDSSTQLIVNVLGYYDANDGGGGQFYWAASDTSTADGGMVISASSLPVAGRWNRIAYGYVDVKWYGAKGNNSANDTTCFTAANTYAADQGWYIVCQAGNYVLTCDPTVTVPVHLMSGAVLVTSMAVIFGMDYVITDREQHFSFYSGTQCTNKNATEIYPEWFGAKGDGYLINNFATTDDTGAFVMALACASAGSTIVVDSSKKYWVKSLIWKPGVNLRGSAPYNNESSVNIINDTTDKLYKACLQFNDTSGNLIWLTGNNVQGITVRDLILDGNGTAGNCIFIDANQVEIDHCTIRNSNGNGINVQGTTNTVTPRISNCHIYSHAAEGIYINGTGVKNAIVKDNEIAKCVGDAICVFNQDGYQITGNILDDIEDTGIKIFNDTANALSTVSGNTIRALTNNNVIGIQVTSTVFNTILVTDNNLYAAGTLTGTVGIKTSGAAAFPGDILDNRVVGFVKQYYIQDTATQIRDTTDNTLSLNVNTIQSVEPVGGTTGVLTATWAIFTGNGTPGATGAIGSIYLNKQVDAGHGSLWSKHGADGSTGPGGWGQALLTNDYLQVNDTAKYGLQLGNKAQIQTADKNAQMIVYRDDALGITGGNATLLHVVGGLAGLTGIQYNTNAFGWTGLVGATGVGNLWERESLLRYTGALDISGARLHKGLGFDVICTTPGVDDLTWTEADPYAAQHRWGHRDATMAILGPNGVHGCTGILSVGGLNFGGNDVYISDINQIACNNGTIYYQMMNNVITIRSPWTNATSTEPIYNGIDTALSTTITFPTAAIGTVVTLTGGSIYGKNYQAGQYLLFTSTTKDTWLSTTPPGWWNSNFARGKVLRYDPAGSMDVRVFLNTGVAISNCWINSDWPWWIASVGNPQQTMCYAYDGNNSPTVMSFYPGLISWGGAGGMTYQYFTFLLE